MSLSNNKRKASATTTLLLGLMVLACGQLYGCARQSEVEIIRAISMLPRQTEYTRHFEAWIKSINEQSEGRFRIIFAGGPEVIPTFEQADAVRSGVVHMVYGPATYYIGLLPEVEALFASNLTPMQTRSNGGIDLLDRIHREKMGLRYLARAAFIEFHLFTRGEPQLDEMGLPAFQRELIRGGPVWRDFIKRLGAKYVNMAGPDVYMALERNIIQGIGWPIIGLADASWDQHLSYRIDPGVFSSDLSIIFNEEHWNRLSAATQHILQREVKRYERDSYSDFLELTRKLDRDMRASGMSITKLDNQGAQSYRDLATAVIWDRLAKRAPEYYAVLRQKFNPENQALP